MIFLIVTHVPHKILNGDYYAYGPYIREMNLWIKEADRVLIVAPVTDNLAPDAIDLSYHHSSINLIPVRSFNLIGVWSKMSTVFKIPGILFTTFRAMQKADHIHLRCPGNMGLIGLFLQVLFPAKKKTVKYAGNWDNYPEEHRSYKLQKNIAKNTFLSRNTQVLIYGHWPGFTNNCLPFFTASYREKDKVPIFPRSMKDAEIRVVFLGTLNERKRPEYAIEAVALLAKRGFTTLQLDIIGQGPFEDLCKKKIVDFGLQDKVILHGNIPPSEVARFLNRAHVLIFLSKTEGWPKAVAESMWWGCVPVTTAVSCVPWMLDYGKRGMIVDRNPEAAAQAVSILLNDPDMYTLMQTRGVAWAREYTLERFENQVTKLI